MISSLPIKGLVIVGSVAALGGLAYKYRDSIFGEEYQYLLVSLKENSESGIKEEDKLYKEEISNYICEFEGKTNNEKLKDEFCEIYVLNIVNNNDKKFDFPAWNNNNYIFLEREKLVNEKNSNFFVLKINKKKYQKIKSGSEIKIVQEKDNNKIFGSLIEKANIDVSYDGINTDSYLYSVDHKITTDNTGDVNSFKCAFIEDQPLLKEDCEVFMKSSSEETAIDFSSDTLKKLEKSFKPGSQLVIKFKNSKSESDLSKKTLKIFGPAENDELFITNYKAPLIAQKNINFLGALNGKSVVEVVSGIKNRVSFISKIKNNASSGSSTASATSSSTNSIATNVKVTKSTLSLLPANKNEDLNYKCIFKTGTSDISAIEDTSCIVYSARIYADTRKILQSTADTKIKKKSDLKIDGQEYYRIEMDTNIFAHKTIGDNSTIEIQILGSGSEILATFNPIEKIHWNKKIQEYQFAILKDWKPIPSITSTDNNEQTTLSAASSPVQNTLSSMVEQRSTDVSTSTETSASAIPDTGMIKCILENNTQIDCDIYSMPKTENEKPKKLTSLNTINEHTQFFIDWKNKKRAYQLIKPGSTIDIGIIPKTSQTTQDQTTTPSIDTTEAFVKKGSFKIEYFMTGKPTDTQDTMFYVFNG